MKTLNDEQMTSLEYHKYILLECERQWKDNQEEKYGTWDIQTGDVKTEYYNELYSEYADLLGKACCDCAYVSEVNGKYYCNFGDSDEYGKEIAARTYCDEFETI